MIWYTTQEVVMPYQGTPLVVTATDRQTLERWSRSGRTERRRADRARLVLGAAEGQGGPVPSRASCTCAPRP